MFRLVALLSALALVSSGCAGAGGDSGDGLTVGASFYPLAYVVQQVGEDQVRVEGLTPPGAEPHDLELTPGQIRALAGSDLVVYLGGGFQPSLEAALDGIETEELDVLEVQSGLREAAGQDGDETDLHVWLDPKRLADIASAVADRLAEIDPNSADRYRSNADRFTDELSRLDEEFTSGLSGCERDTFVTSHEAFGYLAEAYGLNEVGISGIDPESEPSPRRLAEVAEFVRDNDVEVIYYEVLVPARTAETLADEVGVRTAQLDPIESEPEDGDYLSAMRSNLDALIEGLGCS